MKVPAGMFDGNAGLNQGHAFIDPATGLPITLRDLLVAADAAYATVAAVQAIKEPYHGGAIDLLGKQYRWNASSLANDSTGQVAIRPTVIGASDPGRFERASEAFALDLTFTFATADGAALFTVPDGWALLIQRGYYEVLSDFTGGTASAIGVSSNNAAYNTKGDLIGGAAGDVEADLAAGIRPGTIGAKIDNQGIVVLIAGNTIRFDRITSAFTTGAANAIIPVLRV